MENDLPASSHFVLVKEFPGAWSLSLNDRDWPLTAPLHCKSVLLASLVSWSTWETVHILSLWWMARQSVCFFAIFVALAWLLTNEPFSQVTRCVKPVIHFNSNILATRAYHGGTASQGLPRQRGRTPSRKLDCARFNFSQLQTRALGEPARCSQ